jgi:glycosyltransferase involved in cell wall biosynthesis
MLPLFFDWNKYLDLNNDLKEAGIKTKNEAISHYIDFGNKERRRYINIKKVIFFIQHENTYTGACNALTNVQKFFDKNNILTITMYLSEIYNIDIISYIKNKSQEISCIPIVICNTLACSCIIEKFKFSNIKVYWYIHEWIDENQTLKHFGINNIDIFDYPVIPIFISKKSYLNIKKYVPFLSNKKIIYNGLSLNNLQEKSNEQIPVEKKLCKNTDDIIISIIGTICNRKNQQKFIDDVFYKCKNKYANIKLLLVGAIHIDLIVNENYSKDIIIIGEVPNALPYINISDIVVSYSINEVFPLNILESFYLSKPVISSNVGAIDEIIIHNENGFLFDCNDSDTCLKYLCNLIDNADLRKYIGRKCKNTFLTKYDENITFPYFLNLINFDWNKYIDINQDLIAAGMNTEDQCMYHYLYYGINEKRELHVIENDTLIHHPFSNSGNAVPNHQM